MTYLNHLVFDVETLSTFPNAVVLSLACVPFVFENNLGFSEHLNQGFYVKFVVEEQVKKYHRHIEPEVINWWKEQDKEVLKSMASPSSNDVSVEHGLTMLSKFIGGVTGFNAKKSYVWSRGIDFDFPIIKSLYRDANMSLPYNQWKVRDIRTAIDILYGTDNGKYALTSDTSGFKAHNPLHDAAMDASRLTELYHLNMSD